MLQVRSMASPLLLLGSVLAFTSALGNAYDLVASESVAKDYKVQSVESGSNGKYGYPYRIAPTLTPNIQARSDDDDDENEAARLVVPVAKPYGSRIPVTTNDDTGLKKGNQKKPKTPHGYGVTRRQDSGEVTQEKRFRSYKEPKYRNFDELESDFRPRRMDINIPYSQYDYRKFKPDVSPIDPYLTPSANPGDVFYPVPKMKPYRPSSYGHGSHNGPAYGAGKYEDPIPYPGSYGGLPHSYPSTGGLSPSYPSSGSPSYSSGGQHGYHENYSIKSNEPIIGSIRKKLLNYAGASDLYEGEPDYLRQVARKKYKYGNLGNDYHGGPIYRDSYRDFPYVESKISLIKKSQRL